MGNIVVAITFDLQHAFGTFEKLLIRAAGENYLGSGTSLGLVAHTRDIGASFDTLEEANAFATGAKSIAERAGVEIRVSTGDHRYRY